ncbi:hypothetical protein C1I91_11575 [Clostridium manihotivorum]|uniref:Uncharacterized protein n=1 Tax=Clostridium manihotivorum TaxID=2320868 RepID=A0A3R5V805_9CLOT|nr:hypothetical protein C1I91_11575 [Clostridium manihotivorum]
MWTARFFAYASGKPYLKKVTKEGRFSEISTILLKNRITLIKMSKASASFYICRGFLYKTNITIIYLLLQNTVLYN